MAEVDLSFTVMYQSERINAEKFTDIYLRKLRTSYT